MNVDTRDIEDMKQILYSCYKSLKSDENMKMPKNIDIPRIIELKRKLDGDNGGFNHV